MNLLYVETLILIEIKGIQDPGFLRRVSEVMSSILRLLSQLSVSSSIIIFPSVGDPRFDFEAQCKLMVLMTQQKVGAAYCVSVSHFFPLVCHLFLPPSKFYINSFNSLIFFACVIIFF